MAFIECNFFAETLGFACTMDVFLPEKARGLIGMDGAKADGDLPVLYLLHGMSDDHSIWQRRTSIERYAAGKKLAVVMPAVQRSAYTNQKHGYRYFDFVSEELPAKVQSFFHVSNKREDTFAAGLSMGGYGALKLGLRCPDKFAAVAGLSAGLSRHENAEALKPVFEKYGSMEEFAKGEPELYARNREFFDTFGTPTEFLAGQDNLYLVSNALDKEKAPKIFMACGTEDGLFASNVKFRDHLISRGFDVTWQQGPGVHEWGFWDNYIQKVLEWLPIKE